MFLSIVYINYLTIRSAGSLQCLTLNEPVTLITFPCIAKMEFLTEFLK